MSDGLVTRIGKWIDSKFEERVTFVQLESLRVGLSDILFKVQVDVSDLKTANSLLNATDKKMRDLLTLCATEDQMREATKVISDLKTRMEKLELYAGMTRRVDPTKPPVVKGAFEM